MADTLVSEASVARHEGSTPSLRINEATTYGANEVSEHKLSGRILSTLSSYPAKSRDSGNPEACAADFGEIRKRLRKGYPS